jgi:hypothetical protein
MLKVKFIYQALAAAIFLTSSFYVLFGRYPKDIDKKKVLVGKAF